VEKMLNIVIECCVNLQFMLIDECQIILSKPTVYFMYVNNLSNITKWGT